MIAVTDVTKSLWKTLSVFVLDITIRAEQVTNVYVDSC
jgi:hypothetical protein